MCIAREGNKEEVINMGKPNGDEYDKLDSTPKKPSAADENLDEEEGVLVPAITLTEANCRAKFMTGKIGSKITRVCGGPLKCGRTDHDKKHVFQAPTGMYEAAPTFRVNSTYLDGLFGTLQTDIDPEVPSTNQLPEEDDSEVTAGPQKLSTIDSNNIIQKMKESNEQTTNALMGMINKRFEELESKTADERQTSKDEKDDDSKACALVTAIPRAKTDTSFGDLVHGANINEEASITEAFFPKSFNLDATTIKQLKDSIPDIGTLPGTSILSVNDEVATTFALAFSEIRPGLLPQTVDPRWRQEQRTKLRSITTKKQLDAMFEEYKTIRVITVTDMKDTFRQALATQNWHSMVLEFYTERSLFVAVATTLEQLYYDLIAHLATKVEKFEVTKIRLSFYTKSLKFARVYGSTSRFKMLLRTYVLLRDSATERFEPVELVSLLLHNHMTNTAAPNRQRCNHCNLGHEGGKQRCAWKLLTRPLAIEKGTAVKALMESDGLSLEDAIETVVAP